MDSAQISDGGPAFPQNDAAVNRINNHDGMSLRDYFAVRCLPISRSTFLEGMDGGWDALAAHAYSLADALLRARAKP